ncbi:MAG: DnaJ C-terminal domain-containing protein [Polyangiaceae bacterium]
MDTPFETLRQDLERDPTLEHEVELTPRELAPGTRVPVKVARFVPCPRCSTPTYRSSQGCAACRSGLVMRDEKLIVRIPAKLEPPATLRLAGKGHELPNQPPGDLLLAIRVQPTLTRRWGERASRWARTRTLRERAIALGVTLAAVLAVAIALEHRAKARVGQPCRTNSDCRSGYCLDIVNTWPLRTTGPIVAQHCTIPCETTADCPASLTCEPVTLSRTHAPSLFTSANTTASARACTHR